jgi:hypothetical protein
LTCWISVVDEPSAAGLPVVEPDESAPVDILDDEANLVRVTLQKQLRPAAGHASQDVADRGYPNLSPQLAPTIPAPGEDRFFLAGRAWQLHQFDQCVDDV